MVATITGEIDAVTGTLSIGAYEPVALPPAGGLVATAALVDLPVVQDGIPGQGPANTVELVTERAATAPGACGAVDAFEGDVRLRSFYPEYELRDAYVEIVSITPTGREACNSAPAVAGVSDQYGLFAYGTLAGSGASTVATWRFRLPDATRFTFTGRVVADLVDATPPVTSAAPAGGAFDATQVVTLDCADGGGGCAATHYTLDGSEPTTASPPYAGPITIASSTTVRFLSVDAAGNAEAPRSETYVIDTLAPTVVAVDPHDGQGDVAVATAVRVTFSEPMDAATVAGAITLTGPGGRVSGTVALESGSTWTFTPSATLDLGTRYWLAVSTEARDQVGHPVAAAWSSWFVTVTAPVVVSGEGSANYVNRGVAEDVNGNRLAIWSANTYAGAKLMWSYFDATAATWTPAQAIYAERSIAPPEIPIVYAVVVASGSKFLVAWQARNDAVVNSSIFTGGTPGPVTKHWKLRYEQSGPALAAAGNGTGFALVGSDYSSDRVYGAVHDGTSWRYASNSVDSGVAKASNPSVAPLGTTSWVAAYRSGETAIYTSRYNPATQAWAATLLPGATGTATMVPPAVAASGTRVCVGWGTTAGAVMASVDAGSGTFGTATDIGTGSGAATAISAAANGNRFGITWNKYGATYEQGPTPYWIGRRDLTSTSAGYILSGAFVAPAGDGFVAGLGYKTALGTSPMHVTVNKDTVGTGFLYTSAVQGEAWAEEVRNLTVTGRAGRPALVSWDRDDGAGPRVETKTYDGSTLGAETPLSVPGVGGSAGYHVRLARNAAGDVLAAWHQDDGSQTAVFAALRRGGTWGSPTRLARHAREPELASNGTGFMMVYRDIPIAGDSNLTAIEYSAGAWGAPVLLQANAQRPAVASDGGTYAAVWEYGTGINAAIKGTAGWSAPTTINTTTNPKRPAIAARPGEYVVAWYHDGGSINRDIRARGATVTSPIGAWSWLPERTVFYSTYLVASSGPAIAAGPGGFAVAWGDDTAARASLGTGAGWGAATTLAARPNCGVSKVVSSAAGWLAAFDCSGVQLAWYAAGAWSATVKPAIAASDLAIASDGARYKVLARVTDGSSTTLDQIDVVAGTAYPPTILASGTSPSTAPVEKGLSVVHDGANWVGAWIQQGPDVAVNRVNVRTAF